MIFDPRYVQTTTEPAPVDLNAELDCLIDVFGLADGTRRFVVLAHDGNALLLDEAAVLAEPRICQQLAVFDMVCDQAPRQLNVKNLCLMMVTTVEPGVDLKGPNDPVNLRGRISGPWLGDDLPHAASARLMTMRADVLSAMATGFLDQFITPTTGSSGVRVWNNLWLPTTDADRIQDGEGCILAYPHNPLASFLETGNDQATRALAEQILIEFRDDLVADSLPGRLRDTALPVACLKSHKETLAANGIVLRDNKRVAPPAANAGWLKRAFQSVFPKLEKLPAEGDVGLFCSLAAIAVEDLGDWPSPRSRALMGRLKRFRAMWTPQLHSNLQPVRFSRDGQFAVRDGILEAVAGVNPNTKRLYFDVDDGFAASIAGEVELEFEFRDDGNSPITIHYNGREDYQPGPTIPRHNTGNWLSQSVTLPEVAFRNGQNAGADFRFDFAHGEGALRRVILKASRQAVVQPAG